MHRYYTISRITTGMKLFSGHTCSAAFDPHRHRLIFTFQGYALLEEHKSMYLEVMDFILANPSGTVTTILMDMREMTGTFTLLNNWVINTLRPAVDLGLSKAAMVLSEDVFTTFSASDALTKVKLIRLCLFTEKDAAASWLDEM